MDLKAFFLVHLAHLSFCTQETVLQTFAPERWESSERFAQNLKAHLEQDRRQLCLLLNIVAVSSARTCTISTKDVFSSPFSSSQRILLYVDLWMWFLTFTYTFLQSLECSERLRVLSCTNGWSATSSSLAKAGCFLIISCVFCTKNVWLSTTLSEFVSDLLARAVPMLRHLSFVTWFIMSYQLRKLRRLHLWSSDVSFDHNMNWISSSVNFLFPCRQNFKKSCTAQNRYLVLSSIVTSSKGTSQSTSLLSRFHERAAPTAEVRNSCSMWHRKFVGVDEGCVASCFHTNFTFRQFSTLFWTILANALVSCRIEACRKYCKIRSKTAPDREIHYKGMLEASDLRHCKFSKQFHWKMIVSDVRLLGIVVQ